MEINPCRTRSDTNDKNDWVCVPWVGPRSSWRCCSARCQQGPPGWSCWWCCARAPLPQPVQTEQNQRGNKIGKSQTADMLSSCFGFKITNSDIQKGAKKNNKKTPTCVWVMTRVNTEWDLELLSFIPVAAVARCLFPRFSQPFIRKKKKTHCISQATCFLHTGSKTDTKSSSLLNQSN